MELKFVLISVVGVFVALTIVILFITFNTHKNKLIQEKLEDALKNQKREHELELKALRSQMNPHFVHNSLNAIQYYIQQNDVETSEEYLAKFSKLMRQFFDFSRQKTISLSEEISLLKNYLYIEKLRFEDKLKYTIEIDENLDVEEEQIPTMLLQPIVENAVNHGLFHKKTSGQVKINLKYINEGSFRVIIEDDGIGINASKAMKSTIKKANKSHSSVLLEERINFLNQSNMPFVINFSIKDLSEQNNNTAGTKVSLIFKQQYNE